MPITVLFLCRDNAIRSILAEAVLNSMAKEEFTATSAGFDVEPLHPLTIGVLRENFLDTSCLRAKSVQEFAEETFDYVIELADRDDRALPAPVRARVGHFRWGFKDPTQADSPEQRLHAFRHMIVELRLRMALFIAIARREACATPPIEAQALEIEEVA
jgi:arsenate reductase